MQMKYEIAWKETRKLREIIEVLGFTHINPDRVVCVKSFGSKTRRTIARIHGLPKVLQLGMQLKPFYVIELISERFFKESPENQTRTLIHELMHIPHNFGGGFRKHKPFVTSKKVEQVFNEFKRIASQR
jgi:predicted metallopeptidase